MNIEGYSIFSGRSLHSGFYTFVRNLEYVLLFAVAAVGLVGSIYIFVDNSMNAPQMPNGNLNYAPTVSHEQTSGADLANFKDFIEIKGKEKVDNELTFLVKMDLNAKRYVLEMGDEMRMILTQPEFSYRYSKPGKYTLELKEITSGLITTIAKRELKIK